MAPLSPRKLTFFMCVMKSSPVKQSPNRVRFSNTSGHLDDKSLKVGRATIITARKRSLRRLCCYTCLSVILFTKGAGVSETQCMVGYTPPGSRHPHPLGRSIPPCAVCAGRYGQQTGTTRPPGPKFFQFHAVFGKICSKSYVGAPLGVGASLLGEILDSPLEP